MLKKYFKYIKESNDSTSMVKPDPSGLNEVLNSRISYKSKYISKLNEGIMKVKKDVCESMIETLKKDLIGRLVLTKNEKGDLKILDVKNVIVEKHGDDFYPIIIENKDKKSIYIYDSDEKSRIFFLDDFMTFFEDNFLNKLLCFNGKSINGRKEMRFTKYITGIGFNQMKNGSDQLLIEDDNGNKYILYHTKPIKILDMRVKELDPYGEENWEN